MKKNISSLELAALVNEFDFVNSKISQVYHNEGEVLLQIHKGGKFFLRIVPGKFVCLSPDKKPSKLHPTSFCMQLRKHLNNGIIRKIYQQDAERILVLEVEKEEKKILIIELYSQGNVVLTNNKFEIYGAIIQKKWKDRLVKVGETYQFPSSTNWKKITAQELKKILTESEKRNVAVSLATQVGLGGVYAEELCERAKIDPNLPPKEVKDVKSILTTLKEFMKNIEKPKGHFYPDQITPFPLTKEPEKIVDTYSEAINTLQTSSIVSPYEKKIKGMQKRMDEQHLAMENLNSKIEKNTKKGELIYNNYSKLQKLLDYVNSEQNWAVIKDNLSSKSKIKKVDLKKKTIVVDL